MFFILRCAFWLSIVYATILSPGVFQRDAALGSKMASASKSIAVASEFCRGRAVQCLDDAARLTALLQDALDHDDGVSGPRGVMAHVDEAPPEPLVSPRRGHKERLARAP